MVIQHRCAGVEFFDYHYTHWWNERVDCHSRHLYDYRFEPPWPDRNFEMLPSFKESCKGEAYILPNEVALPRADILNFCFGKTGWRLPFTRIEGALCALSTTPIPEEFKHGALIPVEVKFFGKAGQQLAAASVVLWADRWREPAVTRPTARPPIGVDMGEPCIATEPCVATQPRRSSLYDPSGWGADPQGPPPSVTVHERRAEHVRTKSLAPYG